MNTKIRVDIEVTENELRELAYKARAFRDDPRKSWSKKEFRQFAAIAVQQMIGDWLDERRRLGLMPHD